MSPYREMAVIRRPDLRFVEVSLGKGFRPEYAAALVRFPGGAGHAIFKDLSVMRLTEPELSAAVEMSELRVVDVRCTIAL